MLLLSLLWQWWLLLHVVFAFCAPNVASRDCNPARDLWQPYRHTLLVAVVAAADVVAVAVAVAVVDAVVVVVAAAAAAAVVAVAAAVATL